MAEFLIQDTTLDAIADAINAKTGGSSAMTPAEMVTAIGSIQTGGADRLKTAEITLAQDYDRTVHTPTTIMAQCASAIGTANYVAMLKSPTKTGDDLKAIYYGGVHIAHLGTTLPLTLDLDCAARTNADTGVTLQGVVGTVYNCKAWAGDVYQVWGWD